MEAHETPDLALARRYLATRPPTGEVLLLAVTGSHHYGFSSPDSDLDLKGIHRADTRSFLGLGQPQETHDALTVFEGTECDLTTHEVGKALRLLIGGNGNVLERIWSPFQVIETPCLAALRDLSAHALSRRFVRHYSGYFRGMQREHLREDPPRLKSLLYTYRVALTGSHLLRTGEVIAHLPTLARTYSFEAILALVERKRAGQEKEPLDTAEADLHRARWSELERLLGDSVQASPLPEEPVGVERIDRWLVALRSGDTSTV